MGVGGLTTTVQYSQDKCSMLPSLSYLWKIFRAFLPEVEF